MRTRSAAKDALKALAKSGARGLAPVASRGSLATRILTYHSVGERDHEMNVTPQEFEAQMDWLCQNLPTISLEEAASGKPGVAITFDDGYVDNLRHAAPVLCKRQLPATVFMVAGKAGGMLAHDHDRATSRLMDWEELRELASKGFDVGAHTMTHPRLSQLSESEQREEITRCKEVLETELEQAVKAFAYPYGSAMDYTPVSEGLVREAGYAFAVSNRFGPHGPGAGPWAIRRIWIDATDTLDTFAAKAQGKLDALAWLDSPLAIRARRTLNHLLLGRK